MGKEEYRIIKVSKKQAESILSKFHYLTNISRGFKSGFNFGLFLGSTLIGVCIFTGYPVPELAYSIHGLGRNQQEGLVELSRLCVHPGYQRREHNITSWFLSRSIKLRKKESGVRCILSYADSKFHTGIIYRACNFKYYGLTAPKSDFWILEKDGTYRKHSRGRVKNLQGEWRPRTRKHRFLYLIDKSLPVLWEEKKWSNDFCVSSVNGSTSAIQAERGGSSPTLTLQETKKRYS